MAATSGNPNFCSVRLRSKVGFHDDVRPGSRDEPVSLLWAEQPFKERAFPFSWLSTTRPPEFLFQQPQNPDFASYLRELF